MFRRGSEERQDGGPVASEFGGTKWWLFRRRNALHHKHEGPAVIQLPDAVIHDSDAADCGSTKQRKMPCLKRLDTLDEIDSPSSSKLHEDQSSPPLLDEGNVSYSSDCSVRTVTSIDIDDAADVLQESEMLLFEEEGNPQKGIGFDVAAYMSEREMSPVQEKWNAITVVPNPMFCLYFLLAGKWLSNEAIDLARAAIDVDGGRAQGFQSQSSDGRTFTNLADDAFADENGCIHSQMFPNMYSLPPLPVVAVAVGIILHAPFSFLYHWHYACKLPPGFARIDHWSRRLDHSFIHVISACMSYGTSGSWDYFLANLMFNADCIYRQFKQRVRPRMNKIRILISIIAYTIPILRRGDTVLFCELWGLFAVCGWLFAKYPIGGWSHSAFHVVIALVPPLMMQAACHLLASKEQIQIAARCAILAGK